MQTADREGSPRHRRAPREHGCHGRHSHPRFAVMPPSRLSRLNRGAAGAALAVLLASACSKSNGGTAPTPVTTAQVVFVGGTVTAEIAATGAARETGLMGRTALGQNSGMLFVFALDQQPELVGFWMKGTSLPLSIAFLDASRRVLAVQDMTPFDTTTLHRPATPFRFALEVNQGWLAAHGVTAGTTATFTLPTGLAITP